MYIYMHMHRTFSNMLLMANVPRAATTPMRSAQANSKLSSIAASHSGHSELSSIVVDRQACQLILILILIVFLIEQGPVIML